MAAPDALQRASGRQPTVVAFASFNVPSATLGAVAVQCAPYAESSVAR